MKRLGSGKINIGHLLLSVALTSSASLWSQTTNAPADFNIYSQIMAPAPVKAGFNMEPAPNANITENSWLVDGGFSSYDARQSLQASQDGTATTLIATGNGGTSLFSSVAAGYFVGATARTYRYTGGAWELLRTDTVTGYTANSASTAPADNTITFANSGPQTLTGDVIWLDLDNVAAVPSVLQLDPRFTYYSPTWNNELQSSESRSTPWANTLTTDVPASDPGGLSMKITDTSTETNGIWQYIQGAFVGPDFEEFQTDHTYTVDVWLKQSGVSSGSVTFSIRGLALAPHTITGVTSTWQHFTWQFGAVAGLPPLSTLPSVHLDFSAPGTLWVDNFQLYDAAWPPNTVSPDVMAAWTNYSPGTVRIWSNFAHASQAGVPVSLDSWLTPEIKTRNVPGLGNTSEKSMQLEHLPTALANLKTIGANPWLVVNMALSEQEWGNLIDYLVAPVGVGYAAKRPANHPNPYTEDFPTIYLEVGNEEWGLSNATVNFAYGPWAHFVLSQAIAGKSYFDPGKIKFIVNGSFLSPSFASTTTAAAPEASIVDYALYSSGNRSLTGDAYYQSDLLQVPITNGSGIDSFVKQQQQDAANGRSYELAAYEEGPGQDQGSTTPDTSLAAGIGAVDVNLYASLRGFGPQNLFMYQLGTGLYTSHTNFANGFRPHPVWEALQMRNQYCAGPMVWTRTNTVPLSTDGSASSLIAVYTFMDVNNQADVVVISRDLNNQTPVTLHFPATPTGTAQLYTLTGDPRANNDTALNIPIGTQQVDVTANYTFTMPPGSMYIFQVPMTGAWSTTVGAPNAPASLTAQPDNGKVALSWAPSDGATGYTLMRGTATGGPYSTIATLSGISYTDTGLTNGITYYYVVKASNAGGVSGNSLEASTTPNVAGAGFVTSPPPLDGSAGGAWASVPSVPLLHHFSGSSPDSATYKVLWDSTNLYLLVSVQDSTPIASPTVWSGDSVEVYFSGTDTKAASYGASDFQYAFPWNGTTITETYHHATSGITFAQQNVTGGYQMAIAFPWATLLTTPAASQQYGFDVMIDDANSSNNRLGKLGWWATADNTWGNPSLMGPLVLTAGGSTISAVSATCIPTSIVAGGTSACAATVSGTGSYNNGVTWSATAGSISSTGTYTAPASLAASENVTITATSVQDSTKLATQVIAVAASASTITGVSVSCPYASITTSATDACTATVSGTGSYSSSVTWSVSAGTVNTSGLVTAPSTAGTIVVTATSTQDSTKSGTSSITVNAAPVLSNLVVSNVTSNSVTISWTTSVPTNAGIDYGPTYGTTVYDGSTYTTTPSFTLTGLTPSTTYNALAFGYSTSRAYGSYLFHFTTAGSSTVTGVAVSCSSTTIAAGATSTCTPTVSGTGSYSSAVTWHATAGTISSTGIFTAPSPLSASENVTITATSTQDTTKSGSQVIAVAASASISGVSVSCSSSSISTSATDACTATVSGTGSYSSAVVWSVSSGSVSTSGLVTASTTAGTIVVTATSTQDSTKSGTFSITVNGPPVLSNVVVSNVTETSVTISWTTNVPTNAGIDYGPTYGTNVYDGSIYTTTPSFTLTGLTAGTTYNALAFGYSTARAFGSYQFRFTTAP